jgi:hypothetical protein
MVLRVLALSLALIGGGCASVARGTSEQVAFDTVPSGAEVRVVIANSGGGLDQQGYAIPPGNMGCVTPCVLQMKRADKMAVTITKPGFEVESFALNPEVSGAGVGTAVVGNFLIGGVIGAAVDGVSGAMLDHCPNPVKIALRPLPGTARGRQAPPAGGFTFDPVVACKAQTEAKYATNQPPTDTTVR